MELSGPFRPVHRPWLRQGDTSSSGCRPDAASVSFGHAVRILSRARTGRDAGHKVIEAIDIAEGLASYRAMPSDVVIVDVSEGTGLNGPRFISRLRDEFPTAAVVALSRRAKYGVGDRSFIASQLGAVTVRRMPCSAAEMLEAIETARNADI